MTQSSKRRKVGDDQVGEFDNVFIDDDIILEILLCVPPIAVLKFKLVCKKWYSLLSNTDFLRSHSSLQFGKCSDLLIDTCAIRPCRVYKHFEILSLPQDKLQLPPLKTCHLYPLSLFPEKHRHCSLEDSCNGLILVRFSDSEYNLSTVKSIYYIFNMITKHYFKLPNTNPIPNIIEKDFITYIVFDPSVSLSYKLIRWLTNETGTPGNAYWQIYSSETGSWKLVSTSDVDFDFNSRPTFLNGVLYWSYWPTPLDVSYRFDVEKEIVSFLPLPPKTNGFDYRQCLYFGECGGRLRLIERYLDCIDYIEPFTLPCSFDMMELQQEVEEYPDGCNPWIVKYHVNMGMFFNRIFQGELLREVDFIHLYKIKGQGGGGEEEVLFLNINETSIISYYLTSNSFGKKLYFRNIETLTADFRSFYPFTPTLFPLS